jgi:hypothetical protein
MNRNSIKGSDCRAWIIPESRACNIDTPFDLFLAEQIITWEQAGRGAAGWQNPVPHPPYPVPHREVCP